MTKEQEFLLEIRRLEQKHGLYLHTSEWMTVSSEKPIDDTRDGSLSALFDNDEIAEMLAVLIKE